MKKYIVLLLLLMLTRCSDPVLKKCDSLCNLFIECTEKRRNTKITGDILKNFKLQCIDSCTLNQSQILQCYEEAGSSCEAMAECMLETELND